MINLCEREVHELHRFIERWLKGETEKSGLQFLRFEKSLAPDFVIVQPSGMTQGREAVLKNFRSAYGTRDSSFTIEIRNFRPLWTSDTACVALYEEWHLDAKAKGRLSTAVFERHLDSQTLQWVHVHETVIQERD